MDLELGDENDEHGDAGEHCQDQAGVMTVGRLRTKARDRTGEPLWSPHER
jgi:hypothetical protein